MSNLRPWNIPSHKDYVKKVCTDKTELSNYLNLTTESEQRYFTPGQSLNFCTEGLFSKEDVTTHKNNFCSLKPEHSVCPTPSSPTPSSPTPSSPAPSSPTPSSPTSTSPTPSSDPQSNTNSTLPMSISASMSSCSCSCLVIIILVVMSQRKR